MHPADIVREIEKFSFFRDFGQEFLLQIATMLRPVTFPVGTDILVQGELNEHLYFLREGSIDVLVENESVFRMNLAGEVIGEISALSAVVATATLRTRTECRCFALDSKDFDHVPSQSKDRFQFLLYKLYSNVLTERLTRTNEKAKLFEQTARELKVAKSEIEALSSAQMAFLKANASESLTTKTVAILDTDKKISQLLKSSLGAMGLEFIHLQSIDEVVSMNADVGIIPVSAAHLVSPQFQPQNILLYAETPYQFSNFSDLPAYNNLVSLNPLDRSQTIKNLIVSLTKLTTHKYFGIEKELTWGVKLEKRHISSSQDRAELWDSIRSHLKKNGLRNALLDRVGVSLEEMLMNALYDAPTDSQGNSLFNHLARTDKVILSKEQQIEILYGFDGLHLGISVTDSFGSLKAKTLTSYLGMNYQGAIEHTSENKGGAGRGLHQIIESADHTIFNVQAGKKTEAICLWRLEKDENIKSTLNYFFV